MSEEQLRREEDARYREIDRVIEKADADSDAHSDDQDRDRQKHPESDSSDE